MENKEKNIEKEKKKDNEKENESLKAFSKIAAANKTISTTDIKGKDYAEVNQRIKAFRMVYPLGAIETEMLSIDNGVVIFKVFVKDENGTVLGTGHAYEKEGSTFINKTSYIENCETSAVGRALGMCGFGIDTSVASYEEVQNAIANQNEKPKPTKQVTPNEQDYRLQVINLLKTKGIEMSKFAIEHNLTAQSSNEDFKKAYEILCKM